MVPLAISLLWVCIGIIILAVVVFILLSVLKRFFPAGITPNIEYGVWAVFGILCLIYILTALVGGGGFAHPYFHSLN